MGKRLSLTDAIFLSFPIILPLAYVLLLPDPVRLPSFLLVCLLLLGYSLTSAINKTPAKLILNSVYPLLLLVIMFMCLVSLCYSVNKVSNLFEFGRWAIFFVLWVVGSNVLKNDRHFYLLALGVMLSALLQSIIGLVQISMQMPFILRNADFTYFVTGTFIHKNLFSSALLLSLPFCLIVMRYYIGKLRWLTYATVMVITFNIFIVQTRSVWLAIVVAMLVIFDALYVNKRVRYEVWPIIKQRWQFIIYPTLFFVLCFIAIYLIQPNSYRNFSRRVETTILYSGPKTQSNETVRERFFLWRNTTSMIADHPLLGVGSGNWAVNFPKYALRDVQYIEPNATYLRPHNDFLLIWAENGIFVFFAYCLLFLIPLFQGFLLWLKAVDEKWEALALSIGMIAWLVVAQFEYPFERTTHVFLLMLTISRIMALHYKYVSLSPYFAKRIGNKVTLINQQVWLVSAVATSLGLVLAIMYLVMGK